MMYSGSEFDTGERTVTTILLADDHHVVRQGLRALLDSEPDFSIAGEVADGLEVAEQVEKLEPDVLVLDLMMPGLNGMEVTRLVRQRSPDTNVVILSMYSNESYVLEALRNGAIGYVLKGSSASDLIHAIREASAGRRYLSPSLTERAIEAYINRTETTMSGALDTLTNREREVLYLAAEGYKNPEIAGRLSISPRTVETHRANLMRKLGLNTQAELIRYCVQRGIFPMRE